MVEMDNVFIGVYQGSIRSSWTVLMVHIAEVELKNSTSSKRRFVCMKQ